MGSSGSNDQHLSLAGDVVVSVRNVSKKFCKNLRRSMAYGIKDLAQNLGGISPDTTSLRKDEFWALENMDFELKKGRAIGLIGMNGSGKTTLLRLLAGIFPPDKGEIMIKGRVSALIALGAGFHPYMTGHENIFLNGAILGMTSREIASKLESIVDFANIGDFLDAPVSTYSSGMRVRLGFSIAIHCNPDVLLIDEILAVGDLGFRAKCYGTVQKLRDSGCSIVVVSHNIVQLLKVVDEIMVLDKGKKHFQGDVYRGITIYEDLIHRSQTKNETGMDGLPVCIKNCVCRDFVGNETYEFATGDDVILEFHYESTKDFNDVDWLVAIHSVTLGSIASFTNKLRDYKIDVSAGSGMVRVVLASVPLLVGAYEIVTHVYNGPDEVIGCGSEKFMFRIIKPPISPYRECRLIHFDSSWSHHCV